MSCDFWAELSGIQCNSNKLFNRRSLVLDSFSGNKDEAKHKAQKTPLLSYVNSEFFSYINPSQRVDLLPWRNCISIEIVWELTTPWFSRSDSEFDAIDNPISRDMLTGFPILKAAGLKGMLAHTCDFLEPKPSEEIMKFCFGDASQNDVGGHQGNVIFGNTVFNRISCDLISPHNRQFGVVDHPVGFEVVPENTKTETGFLIFQRSTENQTDSLRGARLLLDCWHLLLTGLGISAKRSIGYGMGNTHKITIRTGTGIQLGKNGQQRKIVQFLEKKPEEPEKAQVPNKPDLFDVFVDNGKLVCTSDEAFNHLVTIKKLNKNKQKYWKKNNNAKNAFAACKDYLESLENQETRELVKKQEKYSAWQKRKAEWEGKPENQTVYWKYNNFEDAIKAVNSAIKEASE